MLIGLNKYYNLLKERIPTFTQSIILNGQNSIGKKTLLLQILNEIVNNTDNIHLLKPEPDKKTISIEQIRTLFNDINIMPYNDKRHYIIIDDAEQLSDICFNSILKRLEEPKQTELFILVTSNIDRLSDTIKSRCITINIELDSNEIFNLTKTITNPTIKSTLYRLGFSYIIDYIQNDSTKAKFDDAYNLINDLLKSKRLSKLNEYETKFLKETDINLELLISINPTDKILDIYNKVKQGNINKQILITLLVYNIINQNTLETNQET